MLFRAKKGQKLHLRTFCVLFFLGKLLFRRNFAHRNN